MNEFKLFVPKLAKYYLGRGSDIGSELFGCLIVVVKRTGAALDRDIKFSGFSSQRGVPGRDPSLEGGGDTGVFGAP